MKSGPRKSIRMPIRRHGASSCPCATPPASTQRWCEVPTEATSSLRPIPGPMVSPNSIGLSGSARVWMRRNILESPNFPRGRGDGKLSRNAVRGSNPRGGSTQDGHFFGSPGMNVGQDLVLGLKAPVLQGFRGSGGLLGDAHVW